MYIGKVGMQRYNKLLVGIKRYSSSGFMCLQWVGMQRYNKLLVGSPPAGQTIPLG